MIFRYAKVKNMAQRTEGINPTKNQRRKVIKAKEYPDISNLDENDDSTVDHPEHSDVNSSYEVVVDKSFDDSPHYNLRQRQPIHSPSSQEKASPRSSRKSQLKSPGEAKTPRIYPSLDESFSPRSSPANTNKSFHSPISSASPNARRTERSPESQSRSPNVTRFESKNVHSPFSPKKNNNQDDGTSSHYMHICLFCLILSACLLFLFIIRPSTHESHRSKPVDVSHQFKSYFQEFKEKFPNQDSRLWKTLKAPVKRTLMGKSDRPGVLLFSSTERNQITSHCIAKHYAKLITRVFNATEPIRFSCRRNDNIKKLADTELKSGFNDGSRVAWISSLEDMPSEAAMLFHAYCDNENAPFKQVTIMFHLLLRDQTDIPAPPTGDAVVEDYLDGVWQDMDVNDRRALISRIANNIVFVKQENADVLEKFCD